ncbi:hypothetical protein IQ230_10570 [Gloeocapsopsis crepidinum LEGE 06123]|uniref:Uncharacterized protein n=1 Tax=Gloeocapsopsis crepidinum LEGE 06123 TaxID=588587 RepID=A0ABR9UR96_9CHRO|nr:DUF6653 family protein [Gloeocapsopsis crepidinum]MBE9190791.1 hypothetical protein [Gloeocapsopsis crepidinum LEGE 06123]
MTLESKIAAAFSMSDDTWARHANPWSVGTRFTVLPLLILAIWSRAWLGWRSLIPISIVVVWMWINPRIFPPPASTNSWAAKAVLGERVWLNRDKIPVPEHHRRIPSILSIVSTTGMLFVIYGLVTFNIWSTLLGTVVVYLGKLWFIDRMVWLYEDMKDTNAEYRSWLY